MRVNMADEEPVLNVNVDELTDYVIEKLRREGTSVPRALVARILTSKRLLC